MSAPELEVLQRFRAGDREAFQQLVRDLIGPIARYLTALTGDPEHALDLTQETFLRLFVRCGSLRAEASFRPWLFAIATNVARNDQRWWRRRIGLRGDSATAELAATPAPAESARPDLLLLRDERTRQLRRAVRSLPFKLRTALVLRDLEGLSYQEAAAVLGQPVGTVKSHVQRGRELLRRKLERR